MSHAGKIFAALILVVASTALAAAEPASVESKLNLRSGPGPAFGIIAVVPRGAKLDVRKCTDEWCRVSLGRQTGYANRALLKVGSDSFASATPPVAPAEPKPTMSGVRVWQWHDSDWRNAHWRQLDYHNRLNQR